MPGAFYGIEVFNLDMTPVLTQMGILVFIMAVGFLCTKLGVTGPEFTRSGSKVVINVLLVFTILDSVTSADMELSFADVGIDLAAYFAMILVAALMGWLTSKLIRAGRDRAGIAAFSACYSNTVFVGFPVVESIFGAEGILVATISNIPFNLLIYTLGVVMMNGSARGMSAKNAITPPLVATIIAVGFFMTGWQLPEPVVKCFDIISGGTVPVSMLVVGASLGSISVREALSDWRVYAVSFVRLIAAPAVTWLALRPFIRDEMLLGVTVILAACPTAMLATALAIRGGKDEAYASQCVFVSTVLSAATMPLMIWLLL